jgi:hypothetical protein
MLIKGLSGWCPLLFLQNILLKNILVNKIENYAITDYQIEIESS